MPALSISDKLALELIFIIKEHLCGNDYSREQFELQILLTLSKNLYVNKLLFRDLSLPASETMHVIGNERIHDQAITYLYQVLARRLRLARNLIDKPSNMHCLFAELCRFQTWQAEFADIRLLRSKTLTTTPATDATLSAMQERLQQQRQRLADSYDEESRRRRAQFGPIFICFGTQVIELPEEMSLFDVMHAVPKQLDPAFATTTTVRNLLIRVVKSLNERYMLLRSCGLDPQQWLESEELSISNLRDMKQLKKLAESLLRSGTAKSALSAYRQAFMLLQGQQKKLAGSRNFNDFALSKHGSQLMNLFIMPVATSVVGDSPPSPSNFDIVKDNTHLEDNVIVELDSRRRIRTFLTQNHHDIDAVMKTVFAEIIIGNRSLFHDINNDPLLHSSEFRKLLDSSPDYRGLDDTALMQKIYCSAEKIINTKLDITAHDADQHTDKVNAHE